MFHQNKSSLLTELGSSMSAEEDPSMPPSHSQRRAHLSQSEAEPEHQHHQQLEVQRLEHHGTMLNATSLRPNTIENGDPSIPPNRLQNGVKPATVESDLPHTSKKSPSNQELPKSKWGTPGRRTKGHLKAGLQITVPDQTTPKLVLLDPILHEESVAYIYSSSSSGSGRTTRTFGAIGDHRSSHTGPSSAPLISSTPAHSLAQCPVTAAPHLHLALHDLVKNSIPDSNHYEHFLADEDAGSLKAVSTIPLHDNVPDHKATHKPATATQFQDPTAYALTDSSVTDSGHYEHLEAGKPGPLRRAIMPYRIAPSGLRARPRRRRSMPDLRERPVTTSVRINEDLAKSHPCVDGDLSTNTRALKSALQVDGALGVSEILRPQTWRRTGPSFASSIQPLTNLQRGPTFSTVGREPTPGEISFQDRLDPGEFFLPYGVSSEAQKYKERALI